MSFMAQMTPNSYSVEVSRSIRFHGFVFISSKRFWPWEFARPTPPSHWPQSLARTVHGLAVAGTTSLGRPSSLLPRKNTALYWRVSGLPAVSKGRLSMYVWAARTGVWAIPTGVREAGTDVREAPPGV